MLRHSLSPSGWGVARVAWQSRGSAKSICDVAKCRSVNFYHLKKHRTIKRCRATTTATAIWRMHETPSKRKTCFEPFDPCHFSPAFDGVFNVSGVGRNMTGQIGASAAATPPLWVALYFVPGSISEIVFAPFFLHSFCRLISSLGWREMRNPALHCKHGHEETLVLLCSLLSFKSASVGPPPLLPLLLRSLEIAF